MSKKSTLQVRQLARGPIDSLLHLQQNLCATTTASMVPVPGNVVNPVNIMLHSNRRNRGTRHRSNSKCKHYCTIGPHQQQLLVTDSISGRCFSVDTGAQVSVIPATLRINIVVHQMSIYKPQMVPQFRPMVHNMYDYVSVPLFKMFV